MSTSDTASGTFLEALVPIIIWFMNKDAEDYAYAKRNSDDCWYPPTCKVMTELIPELQKSNAIYSKATALTDSKDAVDSIFDEFKDTALADVYKPQCIANGYNSTTMQLLANNAYAKTVVSAAKFQLDTIASYAGIRVNDLQVMAQLISAIKNSLDTGNISQSHVNNQIEAFMNLGKLASGIYNDNTNPNYKTP